MGAGGQTGVGGYFELGEPALGLHFEAAVVEQERPGYEVWFLADSPDLYHVRVAACVEARRDDLAVAHLQHRDGGQRALGVPQRRHTLFQGNQPRAHGFARVDSRPKQLLETHSGRTAQFFPP